MFKDHGGNLAEVSEQYGWAPSEILDFSANINPLGPPKGLVKTGEDSLREISSYPDPDSRNLVRKASSLYGLPPSQILAGNGSTEFIFLIPRVSGCRTAVIFHPTYQDYELSAQQAGCLIKSLVLGLNCSVKDLHLALSNLNTSGSLVFICNPNNPTGRFYYRDDLLWLVRRHPDHLFIVDEAYADFIEHDSVSLIQFPLQRNVVVLRSLTKNFSVPGLRLGLLFGPEEIIRKVKAAQDPWSVNTLAQKCGEYLIGEKQFLDESRVWIGKQRNDFIQEIRQLADFEPLPSGVNFILVRLQGKRNADELKRELLKDKLLIRSCQRMRGLGGEYIRLAVKKADDRKRLLSVLIRSES